MPNPPPVEPEGAVLLVLSPEWMATIRRNIHSRYSHVDGEIDAWGLGLVGLMADSLLFELDAQLIEARELRVRLAAVEQERDVLRTTATTFLARFDELMPHVSGFIITACVRAGITDWGHGNWTNELTIFRAALATSVVSKEEE